MTKILALAVFATFAVFFFGYTVLWIVWEAREIALRFMRFIYKKRE